MFADVCRIIKIISADPKKLYSTKEDDKKKFDEMFNK